MRFFGCLDANVEIACGCSLPARPLPNRQSFYGSDESPNGDVGIAGLCAKLEPSAVLLPIATNVQRKEARPERFRQGGEILP